MSAGVLIVSAMQSLLVFAIAAGDGTIVGSIVAGCFMVINTAITLVLTRPRREGERLVREVEVIEEARERHHAEHDPVRRPGETGPSGVQPRANREDSGSP